jgi:hypothetical protein
MCNKVKRSVELHSSYERVKERFAGKPKVGFGFGMQHFGAGLVEPIKLLKVRHAVRINNKIMKFFKSGWNGNL